MKEKSCGAIIINDDKVLIVKQNLGFYSFPKGHVEENETEIETAIREVKEETNLNIIINEKYRYLITYQVKENIFKDVVLFLASATNPNDYKCEESEIAAIKWVGFNEALELLSYRDLKEVLAQVLSDLNYKKS